MAPVEAGLPKNWPYDELHGAVREALFALPDHFDSEMEIPGVMATDIHTLGQAFGAAIEEQVVGSLNKLRTLWDPDRRYFQYSFVRQPQGFPDVLLKRHHEKPGEENVLFGIELKSWYLLAKEGRPNFRFTVNAEACGEPDLLAVVPWALSDVLSGAPRIFEPYVVYGKWGAQFRNHHWQYVKRWKTENVAKRDIVLATGAHPYPATRDPFNDAAVHDKGKNFGRLARTGVMKDFIRKSLTNSLRGIPAGSWSRFFKTYRRLEEDEPEEDEAGED